ncbi:MAG: M1 family metallopeptidase [Bacteroidia bacterium]|nr:M1 family metallopeptidase [Bacteroidia bacterium]
MKKVLTIIIVCIIIAPAVNSQIINNEPLSERITGYRIDAILNTSTKSVTGTMEAYWVNKSADIVPDIRLHMYMNAFRSNKSTLYKEMAGRMPVNKEEDNGWIEIKSMTDKNGLDLSPGMQYISPDDGNTEDSTVLRVLLPQVVLPGDSVLIKVNFETNLPSRIRRTGYNDDFFFVAQWFPKFGVYEPAGMRYATKGEWNCHQFHANSEFYSNHSVYDVKITLPKEYVVGTGGLLTNETDAGDGKKTLTYRAEDIVDFAWTAWPGYAVFTDQWKHIKITLLLPKERVKQVARQFTAVKNALEYLTENVGPFPWPYLTFVDPPAKGGGSGGMEYTTLFTSSSSYKLPGFIHMAEMVTIHEFGHAYFMGILASNEFEEPWLDEGVNSFWEERIVDHYYGKNSGIIDHPWLKIADESMSRLSYIHSASRQAVSNAEYSWNYPHGTYDMMSYMKTANWLYTLMGIIGEETTNEIFKEYYRKWAFKHPSGKDFVNVANEVVTRMHGNKFGPDMNWFFDQTLYGTGICDYKVSGFYNKKTEELQGNIEKGDSIDGTILSSDSVYNAVVELERAGEIMLPVDVLIHFENGDEVRESWDGKSRFKDFTYTGKRTIQWVKIDPEFKIKMDVNYINNSKTTNPDRVPVRRLTNKLLTFMQFFISFISL